MALDYPLSVTPREELPYAIMQGAGLNTELIWQDLMPALGLNQRSAHLPQFSIAQSELARIISNLTAPGADAPRFTAGVSDFLFTVGVRRVEIGIPNEQQMDWDRLFNLLSFWVRYIGQNMLSLSLESMVAAQIFSTANFGAAVAAAQPYTAANLSVYTLIGDLMAAIERVRDQGEAADTIVLSTRNLERASQAPNVIQYTLGQLAGIGARVTANALQAAFAAEGITKVLVGRAQVNTAAKGATPVLSRVWPDNYIWVGKRGQVDAADNLGIPAIAGAGCTPFWEPMGLMTADTYRDEPKYQDIARGMLTGNPTVFNPNAGTLIATSYA